jgi:aryl-alcohol dehydrogenase-like predicted oxidoreductase
MLIFNLVSTETAKSSCANGSKRTEKRDEIFLVTKFGFVKGSASYAVDSSGEYCKKACAESLRILGIETIDLC